MRQHQRLHEQPEHQGVGRRRHKRHARHGDDRAAKTDRRERERRRRQQPDDGRLQFGETFLAAGPQRCDDHADGRDQDRDHFQHRQVIAEKHEAEDRGLDRLGLYVRRGYHEGAVVHREQHQARGDDLAERAEQQPRPERRRRPRHMIAGRGDHDGEEHQRERKAEQEADIGGAPGPQRPGQAALHRIAPHLRQRGGDGEGNPERGEGEHGNRVRMAEALRSTEVAS